MLDRSQLKSRNEFFEITRQRTVALDSRPQRHWRCSDDALAERQRIQIVVKMGSSTAMPRIT